MSDLFIKIGKYVYLQAIKVRRPRNQNLIPFWEKDVSLLQRKKTRCGLTQLSIERFRMIFLQRKLAGACK
jgi:hypothetical protein